MKEKVLLALEKLKLQERVKELRSLAQRVKDSIQSMKTPKVNPPQG